MGRAVGRLLRLVVLSAAALGGLVVSSAAQERPHVVLRAKDSSFVVNGAIITHSNGNFLIDTEGLGVLSISGDLVECEGEGCPKAPPEPPVVVGIHGSRTIGTTLIPNLLRGYADHLGAKIEITRTDDAAAREIRLLAKNGEPLLEVDLQTRGSGSAFKSLAAGNAHIGLADRRMKDSDFTKALEPAGLPDLRTAEYETILGLDGIVLITHPDNPVRSLSGEEVAGIFAGEIDNWKQLGGGDFPVSVQSFGEGSGDRAVLLDGLVRPNNRDEKADVKRWRAYQDMVDAVMDERGAIGYVGRWLAATNDVNMLAIKQPCGLVSSPTDFRMKIEGYALSRRLYAYSHPDGLPKNAAAFLKWATSPAAQPYIHDSHFIDRGLERMRLADMGATLVHTASSNDDFDPALYGRMLDELREADRLSVSFRFKFGSSQLDSESERALGILAERIALGEYDDHEILLVGFTDTVGPNAENTALALRRANVARQSLEKLLPRDVLSRVKLLPQSYGELLPLSCNDTAFGRAQNRRVEVWLRAPNAQN